MGRTPSVELSADDKRYFETGEEPEAEKKEAETPELEAGESKAEPEAKVEGEDGKKAAKEGEKAAEEAPKMVQKKALDAEREARKRAEKEKQRIEAESRERYARLEERLQILTSVMQPEQKPEQRPVPTEDPIAAIGDVYSRLDQFERRDAEQRKAQEAAQRQAQVRQSLEMAYRADAQQFTETNPDFTEAYQFLIRSRQQEYAVLPGFRNNPAALNQAIMNDELGIVQRALQNRESPAEIMYSLAQARGWKPKSEEPAQGKSAEEQVKRLAQAQEASTSLSKGGGSSGTGDKVTLEALDRMSKDEFMKFIASKNKREHNGYDKWLEKQMLGTR